MISFFGKFLEKNQMKDVDAFLQYIKTVSDEL
jgi:hypothetical protein